MATWYEENTPLAKFPQETCDLPRLSDPSAEQLPLIKMCNQYIESGNKEAFDTLLQNNPDLTKCLINALWGNTVVDELKALQHYQLTNIDELITKTAQNAIGINDAEPTAVSTYSGNKIEEIKYTINVAMNTKVVSLPVSGWTNSYPYSQTVSVPGVTTASTVRVLGAYKPSSLTADQVRLRTKMSGYLMDNDNGVGNGTITFLAYKRPTVDFQVTIEGVE